MNPDHESIKLEAQRRIERVTAEADYIRSRPPFRRRAAALLRTLARWLEPDDTPVTDSELTERTG